LTAGQTIAVVVNDSLILERSFLMKVSESGGGQRFLWIQGRGNFGGNLRTGDTIGKSLGYNDRNRNWTANVTDETDALEDIFEERSFKFINSDGVGGEVDFER
jgi:hypothetical protein